MERRIGAGRNGGEHNDGTRNRNLGDGTDEVELLLENDVAALVGRVRGHPRVIMDVVPLVGHEVPVKENEIVGFGLQRDLVKYRQHPTWVGVSLIPDNDLERGRGGWAGGGGVGGKGDRAKQTLL